MEYYDTHCHPHDTLEDCVIMDSMNIAGMALMGVHPNNWENAIHAHKNSPDNTILGFGVHPWFTHQIIKRHNDDSSKEKELDEEEKQEDWYKLLVSKLEEYPNSFVGEIGLDKKAKSQGKRNIL